MTAGRVAVTGVGIVSALGASAESTFDRLLRGERGFSEISLFDVAGQRTRFAAEVPHFAPEQWERREGLGPLSRSDALALAAAHDALATSGGQALQRAKLGIAVGATTGGMLEAEPVLARFPEAALPEELRTRLASYPMSSTAERLGGAFGAPARLATLCSACSSGASAIIQAAQWIRAGDVDCALAGGTDALCRLTVTGFNALGATDVVPCRPFDRDRAGLTLGEGAAFLVLESEERALRRGARVAAWLTGWAAGAEAHHITQPEPNSRMPARLLAEAMERAGLRPDDVDYLNAHGTGTSNDAVESAGIRAAFGAATERLLVSSSKGQIGHTLGAAGAIEAAITVLAIERQAVPPTGGLVEPDAACALHHVLGVGRAASLRAAMSSAFGFGGAGAVLLFEAASAKPRRSGMGAVGACPTGRVAITGVASIDGEMARNDARPASGETLLAPRIVDALEPSRSRRFDVQTALVTLGAERALRDAGLSPAGVGLVAGAAFGSVERTVSFLRTALERGARRAPPAEFPHLLPSSSSGNASIYLGLTGPVMTVSGLDASAEESVLVACDLLGSGMAEAMVAGGVVVRDGFSAGVLGPVCGALLQGRKDAAAFLVLEPEECARQRGARVVASIASRQERAASDPRALSLEPPHDAARAVVIGARNARRTASLLAGTGWSGVPAPAAASAASDGAGLGLAFGAACIARGDADDALVLEWTEARAYAFHLTRPS